MTDFFPGSASAGREQPEVTFSVASGVLKGEDVVVTHHRRVWPGSDYSDIPYDLSGAGMPLPPVPDIDSASAFPAPPSPSAAAAGGAPHHYSFWCVFDGHNGAAAATMSGEHATEILEELLPYGPPEPPDSPYYEEWCGEVQRAVAETIPALNLLFAGRGIVAGCTATLVLQVGWLVTCANVGDSRAVLETGAEMLALSEDYRVATHKGERRRVEAMGAIIAPIDFSGSGPARDPKNGMGPLRIWPGGLCLSRAVGDFDVGESVIPLPHVCQVVLPPTGGRLMIASDGVWDAFDKMSKVGTMARSWTLETCADRMIQTIVRTYGGLRDDTSIIVVDITPPGKTFVELAAAVRRGSKASGGVPVAANAAGGAGRAPAPKKSGGCFCFGGSATLDDDPRDLAPTSLPSAASPNPSVNASVHRSRLVIVAQYDVAAVMGLMPEEKVDPPTWYGQEAGERMFRMMSESMMVWKDAVRMGGSRHGPSPNSSFHRGWLMSLAAPAAAPDMAAGEGGELGGGNSGMRRSMSMHFSGGVAADEDDYAARFGHYSSQNPQQPLPDSREASVRGGRMRNDFSVRAGRQYWEPSVRAGKAFLEPSVRAGRAFYGASSSGPGEYSVRGGTANLPPGIDSSVRGGGAVAGEQSPFAAAAAGAAPPAAAASGGAGSVAAAPQYNAHTSPRPSLDEGAGAQQQLARKSLEEELVPIRTVRRSGADAAAPTAVVPMPRVSSGGLAGVTGLEETGRRGSGALRSALAAAAAADAGADSQDSSMHSVGDSTHGGGMGRLSSSRSGGVKVVRFASDSPVDHFTGLSNSSSVLSAVDEDTAA